MHELTSALREMDLTLQICVAVYHLANYICYKLIMILLINILVVKILTCSTFQTRNIPRKCLDINITIYDQKYCFWPEKFDCHNHPALNNDNDRTLYNKTPHEVLKDEDKGELSNEISKSNKSVMQMI